jgi:hypothetical protein
VLKNFLDRLIIPANGQVLGHRTRKTCWGVNTDSEDHLLIFPTPIHTHIFSNHSNGYGHLNIATCGVQQIAVKQYRK